MKEVSGGKEDKFPVKCAYLRRKKCALLFLAAVTAFCGVFLGFAIGRGEEDLVGAACLLLLLIAATDVLVVVLYVKIRKRLGRYKRVYPIRVECKYEYRNFTKQYYFEVVCSSTRGRIFGATETLYSKKDALRAEEMFRKEELRVFYDPKRDGENFIFPDV